MGLEKENLNSDVKAVNTMINSVCMCVCVLIDEIIESLCPNTYHKQLKEGKVYFGL